MATVSARPENSGQLFKVCGIIMILLRHQAFNFLEFFWQFRYLLTMQTGNDGVGGSLNAQLLQSKNPLLNHFEILS